MANLTLIEELCNKIKPELDADFLSGRRDIDDFKDLADRLFKAKILTKKELEYIKKNTLRVIAELKLYHMVLQLVGTPDDLPTAFQQISVNYATHLVESGRVTSLNKAKEELISLISTAISKYQAIPITHESDVFDFLLKGLEKRRENKEQQLQFLKDFKLKIEEMNVPSTVLYELNTIIRKMERGEGLEFQELQEKIEKWKEKTQ